MYSKASRTDDPVHDAAYTKELLVGNNDNGFRDLLAEIDITTYCRLSWEYNIPLFLVNFVIPETGERLPVDPRNVLAKITSEAEAKWKYKCIAGAELEVRRRTPGRCSTRAHGSTFNSPRRPGRSQRKGSPSSPR